MAKGINVSCQQLMNKYQRLACLIVSIYLTYYENLHRCCTFRYSIANVQYVRAQPSSLTSFLKGFTGFSLCEMVAINTTSRGYLSEEHEHQSLQAFELTTSFVALSIKDSLQNGLH